MPRIVVHNYFPTRDRARFRQRAVDCGGDESCSCGCGGHDAARPHWYNMYQNEWKSKAEAAGYTVKRQNGKLVATNSAGEIAGVFDPFTQGGYLKVNERYVQ